MITSAPLPKLAELAALLSGARPSDRDLARPWMRGGETPVWFSRTAWALAALSAVVADGKADAGPSVWLPDYFCNQSADPLRRSGARLTFYPVTDALIPDWAACRALANAAAPDLFVLVHYFGQPSDGDGARAFCDATGALLVEDAAHALGPFAGIGSWGDVVCYSPHKLLAVPDGALMLVRPDALADALPARPAGPAPATAGWLTRRLLQAMAPAALLRARVRNAAVAFADDPASRALPETPTLSGAARRLLAGVGAGLAAAAAARRANALALESAFAGVAGAAPLFAQPAAPLYRAAWRFADPARAAAVFAALRAQGCPVESWPDLPPEVTGSPSAHTAALRLRATVLTAPVHQTLSVEDLTATCRP